MIAKILVNAFQIIRDERCSASVVTRGFRFSKAIDFVRFGDNFPLETFSHITFYTFEHFKSDVLQI